MNGVPVGMRGRRWAGIAVTTLAMSVGLVGCGGGGGAKGQVGECAKDASGTDDITIVACTDAEAKYKIVGVDERVSSGGANAACLKYDEATTNLWFGKSGEFGRALCLQELKK